MFGALARCSPTGDVVTLKLTRFTYKVSSEMLQLPGSTSREVYLMVFVRSSGAAANSYEYNVVMIPRLIVKSFARGATGVYTKQW